MSKFYWDGNSEEHVKWTLARFPCHRLKPLQLANPPIQTCKNRQPDEYILALKITDTEANVEILNEAFDVHDMSFAGGAERHKKVEMKSEPMYIRTNQSERQKGSICK